MSIYTPQTRTLHSDLIETILNRRYGTNFRVVFYKNPQVFGFTMRLLFKNERGDALELDTEYAAEEPLEAYILTEELYARIALMR